MNRAKFEFVKTELKDAIDIGSDRLKEISLKRVLMECEYR
jgi:hypothetical protein